MPNFFLTSFLAQFSPPIYKTPSRISQGTSVIEKMSVTFGRVTTRKNMRFSYLPPPPPDLPPPPPLSYSLPDLHSSIFTSLFRLFFFGTDFKNLQNLLVIIFQTLCNCLSHMTLKKSKMLYISHSRENSTWR